MAILTDDPFPPGKTPRIPTSIGDREWTIVIPSNAAPYAKYNVLILDQDGLVMDVKNGYLFQAGGLDHLRPADKQALIAMDT